MMFEELFLEHETVSKLLRRNLLTCYVTVMSNNEVVLLRSESLHSSDGLILQLSITPNVLTLVPATRSAPEHPPDESGVETETLMAMSHPLGLANLTPHGLLLLSPSFDFVTANNAFFEMTHLAHREAQGRGWLTVLPTEVRCRRFRE